MGAGVGDAVHPGASRQGERGGNQNEQRVDQQDQAGPHHLGLLHLSAKKFRRAPHHQPGEEHRQQSKHQQIGRAGALPTEHHLQEQVEQGGEDRERHGRIDRAIHRARHRAGGDHRPEPGEWRPEAQLFALKIAAAEPAGEQWIAGLLSGHRHRDADQQQAEHQGEQPVALAPVTHKPPEGINGGRRDDQHRPGAHQVGEQGGVLVGMGGVGADETAAVLTELLDGLEQSDRAPGQQLAGPLQGGDLQRRRQGHRHTADQEEQGE